MMDKYCAFQTVWHFPLKIQIPISIPVYARCLFTVVLCSVFTTNLYVPIQENLIFCCWILQLKFRHCFVFYLMALFVNGSDHAGVVACV